MVQYLVKEIPSKGRGVVLDCESAERGDLILLNDPIACAVVEEWIGQCCEMCLSITECKFICEDCSTAYFCSVECQDQANRLYHQAECLPLCRAIPTVVSPVVRQALQALIHTHNTKDPAFIHLTGDMSYKNDSAVFQHHLLNNGRLLRRMLDDDYVPDLSIEQLAGCIVKVMLNCLSIPPSTVTSNKCVATGIFPSFAMINHACVPNCETSFVRRQVQVRALESITQDTEITTRYTNGGGYLKRKEQLAKYGFACSCDMCDLTNPKAQFYEGLVNGQMSNDSNESSLYKDAVEFHRMVQQGSVTIEFCNQFAGKVADLMKSQAACPIVFDLIQDDLDDLEAMAVSLGPVNASSRTEHVVYLELLRSRVASYSPAHSVVSLLAVAASNSCCGLGELDDDVGYYEQGLMWIMYRLLSDLSTYPGGSSRLCGTVSQIVRLLDVIIEKQSRDDLIWMRKQCVQLLRDRFDELNMQLNLFYSAFS